MMTFVVAEKGRLRMTCKDCVCYEKCKSSRLDFAESANPTHICKYFKNKADFVEVVRCKDCRYRDEMCMCSHPKQEGILPLTYPLDFCSYGERRMNEWIQH